MGNTGKQAEKTDRLFKGKDTGKEWRQCQVIFGDFKPSVKEYDTAEYAGKSRNNITDHRRIKEDICC